MSEDKVVFVAYRNPTPTATTETLVCGKCHNKTWVVEYLGDPYPYLRCCVCGQGAGQFGWVNDEAD